MHSFSPLLLLLVTQLEMTFLEICFLAAVSDDALKGKIGSIRPSHLQRSDAHRCSFAVVGTLGYSLKRIFFNAYYFLLRSQEKNMSSMTSNQVFRAMVKCALKSLSRKW